MLQRKVQHTLQLKLDQGTGECTDALHTLSILMSDTAGSSRASIEHVLDSQCKIADRNMLSAVKNVLDSMSSLRSKLKLLDEECSKLEGVFDHATDNLGHLLIETQELSSAMKEVDSRQLIADVYIDKFQLPPSDIEIFETQLLGDQDLSLDFFRIVHRMEDMKNQCKTRLVSYHQRSGMELMTSLGDKLEMSYERICRWTMDQLRQLPMDSSQESQVDLKLNVICKAMSCLTSRPVYFQHCSDEFSSQRRTCILHGFNCALTSGGDFGSRPIEMYAHDPLRYVSDMLAWIHQTIASERELAAILYHNSESEIRTHLDSCFHILVRPLRERIIQSLTGSVTCLQIFNILQFYITTMKAFLPESSQLVKELSTISEDSLHEFFEKSKVEGESLIDSDILPNGDLSIPSAVEGYLEYVSECISIYESSVSDTIPEPGMILSSLIDPFQVVIQSACETLQLDESDSSVYFINALARLQNTMRPYSICASRIENISLNIQEHLDKLASHQCTSIFRKCNVLEIFEILPSVSKPDSDFDISKHPVLNEDLMKANMQNFYRSIMSFGPILLPQCDRLNIQHLRIEAKQLVVSSVTRCYASLYDFVRDPSNSYKYPDSIVPHTPKQLSTLMDV